jgi:hypothetical protein
MSSAMTIRVVGEFPASADSVVGDTQATELSSITRSNEAFLRHTWLSRPKTKKELKAQPDKGFYARPAAFRTTHGGINWHSAGNSQIPAYLSALTQSCSTTLKREVLTSIPPLYLMKPSFLNLFMNKLTRVRVVPIISASVSCDTFGSTL